MGKLYPRYFAGASSPTGFVSKFDSLYNPFQGWNAILLKGGPGTGKSTLMKTVGKYMEQQNREVEYIYCASDPSSLDALVINDKKFAIIDATAPHNFDPSYPGVCENIINLGMCWDTDKLQEYRDEIFDIMDIYDSLGSRLKLLVAATGNLLRDTYQIAYSCIDKEKIDNYSKRFAKRELPKTSRPRGFETERFLSALTPHGIIFFEDTIKYYADKVYAVIDDYGAASRRLLENIKNSALENGYDVITSYCPMAPKDKLEHIIIPELRLAIVTSNKWHASEIDSFRNVNCQRFTDNEKLKESKNRIGFNKKAAKALINEASFVMLKRLGIHSELEEYYMDAMDFSAVGEIANQINAFLTES